MSWIHDLGIGFERNVRASGPSVDYALLRQAMVQANKTARAVALRAIEEIQCAPGTKVPTAKSFGTLLARDINEEGGWLNKHPAYLAAVASALGVSERDLFRRQYSGRAAEPTRFENFPELAPLEATAPTSAYPAWCVAYRRGASDRRPMPLSELADQPRGWVLVRDPHWRKWIVAYAKASGRTVAEVPHLASGLTVENVETPQIGPLVSIRSWRRPLVVVEDGLVTRPDLETAVGNGPLVLAPTWPRLVDASGDPEPAGDDPAGIEAVCDALRLPLYELVVTEDWLTRCTDWVINRLPANLQSSADAIRAVADVLLDPESTLPSVNETSLVALLRATSHPRFGGERIVKAVRTDNARAVAEAMWRAQYGESVPGEAITLHQAADHIVALLRAGLLDDDLSASTTSLSARLHKDEIATLTERCVLIAGYEGRLRFDSSHAVGWELWGRLHEWIANPSPDVADWAAAWASRGFRQIVRDVLNQSPDNILRAAEVCARAARSGPRQAILAELILESVETLPPRLIGKAPAFTTVRGLARSRHAADRRLSPYPADVTADANAAWLFGHWHLDKAGVPLAGPHDPWLTPFTELSSDLPEQVGPRSPAQLLRLTLTPVRSSMAHAVVAAWVPPQSGWEEFPPVLVAHACVAEFAAWSADPTRREGRDAVKRMLKVAENVRSGNGMHELARALATRQATPETRLWSLAALVTSIVGQRRRDRDALWADLHNEGLAPTAEIVRLAIGLACAGGRTTDLANLGVLLSGPETMPDSRAAFQSAIAQLIVHVVPAGIVAKEKRDANQAKLRRIAEEVVASSNVQVADLGDIAKFSIRELLAVWSQTPVESLAGDLDRTLVDLAANAPFLARAAMVEALTLQTEDPRDWTTFGSIRTTVESLCEELPLATRLQLLDKLLAAGSTATELVVLSTPWLDSRAVWARLRSEASVAQQFAKWALDRVDQLADDLDRIWELNHPAAET